MKAQSSIEYLAIIGLVLLILSIGTAVIWQQNEVATRFQQADTTVRAIVTAADNVYAQGPGAKMQITVYFPAGYLPSQSFLPYSAANNKTILLKIQTPGGIGDIIGVSKANVTGTLPSSPGLKVVNLTAGDGFVTITSS